MINLNNYLPASIRNTINSLAPQTRTETAALTMIFVSTCYSSTSAMTFGLCYAGYKWYAAENFSNLYSRIFSKNA